MLLCLFNGSVKKGCVELTQQLPGQCFVRWSMCSLYTWEQHVCAGVYVIVHGADRAGYTGQYSEGCLSHILCLCVRLNVHVSLWRLGTVAFVYTLLPVMA
jgi:hypothetical protein